MIDGVRQGQPLLCARQPGEPQSHRQAVFRQARDGAQP